jgi:hypothetical protein
MKRKEAVYKGLEFIDVLYNDTSLTSPDFFQISEFPLRLTAGKNLFKLRGNPTNLKVGSYLNIEVLDYNGDPIYSEVIDYLDEDKSRVVAIYIYENTSPGDCRITLIGEAVNAPSEWQNRANVKWTRTVPVNPNIANDTEIIFETLPTVTISEQVGVQLDRVYANNTQFPIYNTGTVRYYNYNGAAAIEITGGSFTGDMIGGTLTVATPQNPSPTPNYTVSNAVYQTTIKKILSPSLALLNTEYTVFSSQSISSHTYTAFDYSAYSVTYEATPQYVPTQNSESFALIQIDDLEPATGDISRIKTFVSNNGTIGSWELINDVELEETEIFVSSTSSLYPYESLGLFYSQSVINTYWEGHTYQGKTEIAAPVLTWTTASINNAMRISSSVNIDAVNTITTAELQSAYNGIFIKDASYKVMIDALGTRTGTTNPKISVYLSGSAFNFNTTDYFNQDFSRRFGKRVGELEVQTNNQRFDDETFEFTADNTGTGTLIFIVESGEWQVSDVRTTSDNESGYTPQYTRLRSLVPTPHKADNQVSFKVEYYNIAGEKSKQINYIYNKNWEGGNRYIDGDYSMLTGSLYVADSLETGVAISGYKNTGYIRSLGYEGFTAGFPGFLMWSGSALSGSLGTKGGVPYSGVGLELFGDSNNYFRYSTIPSELDVHTETFFLGNPATQYISGSNGLLEISSSGFYLTADGDVTASSFIAVNGGDVLFNSNSEFVDGLNVGRILYYSPTEINTTVQSIDSGSINGITSSIFQTFLLPGETRIQCSFTYELDNVNAPGNVGTIGGAGNLLIIEHYISTASAILSNNINTNYNKFSNETLFDTTNVISIQTVTGRYTSGHLNLQLADDTGSIENRQGMYCQIRSVLYYQNVSSFNGTIKLRNFVYRSSRQVGSSIIPPAFPVK